MSGVLRIHTEHTNKVINTRYIIPTNHDRKITARTRQVTVSAMYQCMSAS